MGSSSSRQSATGVIERAYVASHSANSNKRNKRVGRDRAMHEGQEQMRAEQTGT